MPTLADYLIGLAEDPKALAGFRRNPKATVRKADLTKEQRAVLTSGDALRIQHAIEYELGGKLPGNAMIGVILCGPAPPTPIRRPPSKPPGKRK